MKPKVATSMKWMIVSGLIVAEAGVVGYVTLVTWLISAWFVDDAVAAQMRPDDWWVEAAGRFFLGLVISVVVAAIILAVNVVAERLLLLKSRLLSRVGAFTAFACIALAAAAGSILFGIEKPFM